MSLETCLTLQGWHFWEKVLHFWPFFSCNFWWCISWSLLQGIGGHQPILTNTRWFQRFFIFTPNLGEMIQFDEHIFQMGWFNHQLESVSKGLLQPPPSIYGGFLKCWYPTTMGFPTTNDHFGVFRGYHHLRKHPYNLIAGVFSGT